MIRFAAVGHVLGQFLAALAASMLLPLAYGAATEGRLSRPLLVSAVITGGIGAIFWGALPRPQRDLTQREALLLVCATWLAASGFGALPFALSPQFLTFTDAFFEAASGFTTTGATVLSDVELLTAPVQLWRHFTHWLGGMGIVLLGIAILPLVGHGGMQLYRAEFSGARSEKLTPRIAETALALWKIYLALTLAQVVALVLAGMSLFDALCHTFSTLGTGGFSTRTASIAAFDSVAIETVLVIFMLVAGMSFVLQHRLWIERNPRRFFTDVELRAYLLVVALSTAIISAVLVRAGDASPAQAFRAAVFQVTSIVTTTGFATENFELWPPLPQVLLLVLMFVGGCTGSTAGGLKVSRILLLVKVVGREFKRMVERRGVFAVRLGGQVIGEEAVQSLLSLVYLALMVNFAAVLSLTALGVDVLTSISAVAASMFNVGPGLANVGPMDNYGHLPALGKWILSVCMIAGRLEFYTVVVVFTPAFWRR